MPSGLPLYMALDKMLDELNIQPKELCSLSGVSGSRLSQFRKRTGGDMTGRSIDAVLDAAEKLNPRAKKVFAHYIGGLPLNIEQMTLAEKAELLIVLGESVRTGISTDSKLNKKA